MQDRSILYLRREKVEGSISFSVNFNKIQLEAHSGTMQLKRTCGQVTRKCHLKSSQGGEEAG